MKYAFSIQPFDYVKWLNWKAVFAIWRYIHNVYSIQALHDLISVTWPDKHLLHHGDQQLIHTSGFPNRHLFIWHYLFDKQQIYYVFDTLQTNSKFMSAINEVDTKLPIKTGISDFSSDKMPLL